MLFRGVLRISYGVHLALHALLLSLLVAQLLLVFHFGYIEVPVFRIIEPHPRVQAALVSYGVTGSLVVVIFVIGRLIHEARSILAPMCRVLYLLLYIVIVPFLLLRHLHVFQKRFARHLH